MKKEQNVPQVRFKDFTETWEQRKLGDIVVKAVDNRGKTPPISEDGTHPLIEVASLGYGAPDYSKVTKYLDEETYNSALRDYIKENDILFSTVGSIGLVSLMDSREEAAIAQNIVSFRAKENYDAKYLYAMFSNGDNQDKAWRIVMNGVQPSIKVSQLINVEYYVTNNKTEQKRIGEYFSNLDHLITLHQRKCDTLQKLKKFMLQKMFPKNGSLYPEIRFAGFTDAWEQRKFSDFTFSAGEKNKNDLPLEPYAITNEHGFIAQSDAHDDFGYMQDVDRRMYIIVKPNSFAYNPARINVGSLGYYEGTKNVIVSSLYEVFQTVDDVDDIFLNQWFKTKEFKDWIAKLQEGSVRQYFYYDKLCECKMCMPSVEEQQQIGSYFHNLDNLITLHQRKLETLKKLKKSMLQKMFV